MTDLEMTKACAQAMGLGTVQQRAGFGFPPSLTLPNDDYRTGKLNPSYDPLQDDAQAMALMKRFELDVSFGAAPGDDDFMWHVSHSDGDIYTETKSKDPNRAICECVAKMQTALASPPPR